MTTEIQNMQIQCDVCGGRGAELLLPSVWGIDDLMSLSKHDYEWEECYECQGTGWMGCVEVEVEYS